ncbi:MAG: hypothetical protein IJE18_01475 [Bacteroidaceae bacterium]|nr:hypothetical protein [Bacteroidales bacterium]MBP3671263.1 hypothetical protein [Bacteroidaceae bacterium]MBQ2978763.1 hypothetical protein [Bacteroidaceae bacterium]
MAYNFGITLDELYRAVGREVYEQCIEKKSLARVDERGLFPTPYTRNDYEKADGRARGQNYASLQLACEVIDEEGNVIAREGFLSFAEMNVEVCDLLNEFPEGHFTRVVIQLVAFVNIYQMMNDSYYEARVVSDVIDMPLDESPNRIMRIDCQRLLHPQKLK